MTHEPPAIAVVRYLFWILFLALFWVQWGWGVAVAAVLVLATTGKRALGQPAVVPVPGGVRLLLELVFTFLGILALFQVFGFGWGIVLTIVQIVILFLSIKRFERLLQRYA